MKSIHNNNITLNFAKIIINHSSQISTISTEGLYENEKFKIALDLTKSRIKGVLTPTTPIFIHSIEIIFNLKTIHQIKFFKNGFQSWSPSYELSQPEKYNFPIFPPLKLFFLDPELFIKTHSDTVCSHFFTYLNTNGELLYFIPEFNNKTLTHFTYNFSNNELRIIIEVDSYLEEEFTFLDMKLTNSVYKQKKLPPDKKLAWCSWYYYYNKIDEKIIVDNLNKTSELGIIFDYFQIDDGWQENIGDWVENKKFPSGLKELATKISDKGINPGIWIAPFVAERKSKIFQENKHWFIKNKQGIPKIAGFNPLWKGFFYALDITHPEVKTYITDRLSYLKDCGFKLFKCDFLYSLSLKGELYRDGLSRKEVQLLGFNLLKKSIKDSYLLGCGAPIDILPDTFDLMRIGTDTAAKWTEPLGIFLNYKAMPCAFNAFRSSLSRQFIDGLFFINDPDVAYLRKTNLAYHQQRSIIINNYLLSNYFSISDPISLIDPVFLNLFKDLEKYRDFTVEDVVHQDSIYNISGRSNQQKILIWINFSYEPMIVDLPPNLMPILGTVYNAAFKPYETKVFVRK